jgi:hypothetical protein
LASSWWETHAPHSNELELAGYTSSAGWMIEPVANACAEQEFQNGYGMAMIGY